jgi:hypothetical protein
LNLNTTLTPQLAELLIASIAINSTAFEDVDPESGAIVFIGSKTETALLKFAKQIGWANYKDICDTADGPTSFRWSCFRASASPWGVSCDFQMEFTVCLSMCDR